MIDNLQNYDNIESLDDIRERTADLIAEVYNRSGHVLVEALPTTGKSYGAVKAAAETGEPVTIFTLRGWKEQYQLFREWGNKHHLDVYRLPSFHRDCQTMNGEYGDDWAETIRDWYYRGASPKEIHKTAEYVLNKPLPCQQQEGQRCPYTEKWDFDPDDYDVLTGHYIHAHKTKVTADRAVVFDEFPDAYETDFAAMESAISYWLSTVDGIPFENYTDLLESRNTADRVERARRWFSENGIEPDESHVFNDSSAHADAPIAVYTLLEADDLGNGFEYADIGDLGTGVYNRTDGIISLLQPPDLERARAIVALDGTPTERMWELALGERLNHQPVLKEGERARYLEDVLNLKIVCTSEYIKSYNSSDHIAVQKDAALLKAIVEEHGQRPSLITTSTAEDEYSAEGVLESVDKTQHYGNILGSNKFKDTRLGVVIGSNHYGDQYVQKWGAYAGEAVERGDGKGKNLSYGEFGDAVLQHMREHDTLQAAMRFGRDGDGAVVYVHTNTLPDWVPLASQGRVVTTWSDGIKSVVTALKDLDDPTTMEIVEHPAVNLSRYQVWRHLKRLTEFDYLECEPDPDDGRRKIWRDKGMQRMNEYGKVELEDSDFSILP